jgi:tRNA 2-thiouridine synthesizing protein E
MQLDRDGFLLDLSCWNHDVAETLAAAEQIELLAEHWEIIDVLREFYMRTDVSPAMRALVKLVRETLGMEKGTSIYLMTLFGGSPAKTAAKIAGLPRPPNCL